MLLILLYLIINNVIMSAKKRTFYVVAIVLTIVVIVAEISANIFDVKGVEFRIPNIIANVFGFSISTLIPIALAVVFDEKIVKKLWYYSIPILVGIVFIMASPWSGWIFYVSAYNQYHRGPFFSIYILTYLFSLFILLLSNYYQVKQYQQSERNFLLILYSIFFMGTTLQILFPHIHSSWHCITLTLVMYYLFQRELQFKYDILTGVLNRQAFEKNILTFKNLDNAAIILFDLDKFKDINDRHGHTKGDYYLKTAASIINSSFKKYGDCYRIGGDEFCVLSSNITQNNLSECIDSMQQCMREAREVDALFPSISYGYSIYLKEKHTDILDAFQEADEKMYCFKSKKSSSVNESLFPTIISSF